jgi:hypothetical protein
MREKSVFNSNVYVSVYWLFLQSFKKLASESDNLAATETAMVARFLRPEHTLGSNSIARISTNVECG